jgi:hypothetical protein
MHPVDAMVGSKEMVPNSRFVPALGPAPAHGAAYPVHACVPERSHLQTSLPKQSLAQSETRHTCDVRASLAACRLLGLSFKHFILDRETPSGILGA